LKAYVLKHASSITHSQCLRLGHALGLWTRRFHDWAQAKEQEELVESMRGNVAMRDLKFMINYERLVQSIDTYPRILEGSRSLFEAVREGVRKDLDDGAVLIHGDLWSGKYVFDSFKEMNLRFVLTLGTVFSYPMAQFLIRTIS